MFNNHAHTENPPCRLILRLFLSNTNTLFIYILQTSANIKLIMTNREKLYVKAKLDNPKISKTEAAMQATNAKDRHVASVIGAHLSKRPEVIMALAQHNELFESVIVKTAKDWMDSETPRKREISLNAAMFGHDKVHGKATVKLEQQTSVVRININLTGDGDDTPPPEMLDDPTIIDQ